MNFMDFSEYVPWPAQTRTDYTPMSSSLTLGRLPVGVSAQYPLRVPGLSAGLSPSKSSMKRVAMLRWCHHCRAKKMGAQCCNSSVPGRSGIRSCRKVFCRSCLQRNYGESLDDALKDTNWLCPYCRSTCVCTHCRPADEAGGASSERRDSPSTTLSSGSPNTALDIKSQRRLSGLLNRAGELIKQVTDELRVAYTGQQWVLEVMDQHSKAASKAFESLASLARDPPSPRSSTSSGSASGEETQATVPEGRNGGLSVPLSEFSCTSSASSSSPSNDISSFQSLEQDFNHFHNTNTALIAKSCTSLDVHSEEPQAVVSTVESGSSSPSLKRYKADPCPY